MTSGIEVYGQGAMRPETLDGFIGQPSLVSNLQVMIQAAKGRGGLPNHILLAGPPGLGKTSLAGIIGRELGLDVITVSGASLETPADAVTVVSRLRKASVLFIDEIHRMSAAAEETLYPAMEDGELQIQVGTGPSTEFVTVQVSPFVLVGATTQVGQLTGPLRDRFGYHGRLQLYSEEDLAKIVSANAETLGVHLGEGAADVVASRSRGTPRVANQLLRRVRDVAQVEGVDTVTPEHVAAALDSFGVDSAGLDLVAQQLLRLLCTQFRGGPVGLASLASAANETPASVETIHEPHLLKLGLITRTPRGRVATLEGFKHAGVEPPAP